MKRWSKRSKQASCSHLHAGVAVHSRLLLLQVVLKRWDVLECPNFSGKDGLHHAGGAEAAAASEGLWIHTTQLRVKRLRGGHCEMVAAQVGVWEAKEINVLWWERIGFWGLGPPRGQLSASARTMVRSSVAYAAYAGQERLDEA